jgi:FdhE protein
VLNRLCEDLPPGAPATVGVICRQLLDADVADLEAQADRLLGASCEASDLQAAPFLMAALQVYWVRMATTLGTETIQALELAQDRTAHGSMAAVCPVCGSLPLVSTVRAEQDLQGYRYLHCGLCATEWHFVRIKCTHCLVTEGIRYHYVDTGSDAVRAESCDACHTYRKILYQEKDPAVEPLADDLGSLSLDLLMSAESYHRVTGNPLLWQPARA